MIIILPKRMYEPKAIVMFIAIVTVFLLVLMVYSKEDSLTLGGLFVALFGTFVVIYIVMRMLEIPPRRRSRKSPRSPKSAKSPKSVKSPKSRKSSRRR